MSALALLLNRRAILNTGDGDTKGTFVCLAPFTVTRLYHLTVLYGTVNAEAASFSVGEDAHGRAGAPAGVRMREAGRGKGAARERAVSKVHKPPR